MKSPGSRTAQIRRPKLQERPVFTNLHIPAALPASACTHHVMWDHTLTCSQPPQRPPLNPCPSFILTSTRLLLALPLTLQPPQPPPCPPPSPPLRAEDATPAAIDGVSYTTADDKPCTTTTTTITTAAAAPVAGPGAAKPLVTRSDLVVACGPVAEQLKSYQLVGINFLMMLHKSQSVGGAILADEMVSGGEQGVVGEWAVGGVSKGVWRVARVCSHRLQSPGYMRHAGGQKCVQSS